MKILVTGGTGFVGKNLIQNLNNHKVLILTRKKIKNESRGIEYFKCDLNIPKTYLKKIKRFKPQVLVHLAWQGLPNYDEKISFKNLLITKKLLENIHRIKSCKKIIISGSCFEANNLGGKVDENSINKRVNFFSLTKNFLKDWSINLFKDSKVTLAWTRIFMFMEKVKEANH